MTSPLSILLIIGSTVVGPIEAQPTGKCNPAGDVVPELYSGCRPEKRSPTGWSAIVRHSDTHVSETLAWPIMETFPELCERAMREVGVIGIRPDTERAGSFMGFMAVGDYTAPPLNSNIVRCIPTPKGYRR